MHFQILSPYSKSRRSNRVQRRSRSTTKPSVKSMATVARIKNQEVENALRKAKEIRKLAEEIKTKTERQKKADERLRRQMYQWKLQSQLENRENVMNINTEAVKHENPVEQQDNNSEYSANYSYDDSYYYVNFRKKTHQSSNSQRAKRHSTYADWVPLEPKVLILNHKSSESRPRPASLIFQDTTESVS